MRQLSLRSLPVDRSGNFLEICGGLHSDIRHNVRGVQNRLEIVSPEWRKRNYQVGSRGVYRIDTSIVFDGMMRREVRLLTTKRTPDLK